MTWTKTKVVGGAIVMLTVLAVAAVVIFIAVRHHQGKSLIFSSTKELSSSDEARYEALTGTTPEQVAKTFFDACASNDWTEASKFWPPELIKNDSSFENTFTNHYGGIEIISLGKPFKGRVIAFGMEYPGVFVPYEIRLKDGSIRKWQLAIRCDNSEHKWFWDGGT